MRSHSSPWRCRRAPRISTASGKQLSRASPREPLEATIEDTREPLPYKKFRVEYRSLDGVRVRAFLALPVRGGEAPRPLRAIVTVPGYGGLQQGVMLGECQRGYAILQVYPRSQGPSADLWKIDGPDKLTWRLSRPDGAYYQGAYSDVIRGVDYLVSRSDIDRDRIAIAGTSQGGGIALAVASLDPRLKAVVALLPFLCDMRRGARIEGSLVKKLLDQAGVNDEAHLRTLDYFDPLQLVSTLRAPGAGQFRRPRYNLSSRDNPRRVRSHPGRQVAVPRSRVDPHVLRDLLRLDLAVAGPLAAAALAHHSTSGKTAGPCIRSGCTSFTFGDM